MHEFSIITSIMEVVKSEIEKRNAIMVLEIQLEVGELSFLSHDALQFGFRALAENEPKIDKVCLKIITVSADVKCRKCSYSGSMKTIESEVYHTAAPVFQCPECSGPIDIIKGRECVVTNVRMEVD
ncbi:MAG: hydrogenase maturation nickel metallochaperone HypA [Thermoplasmata archaeon]|nr:hydrogenase maturation nickel metallochaperone HypA [Thermoplasmata archaeon]